MAQDHRLQQQRFELKYLIQEDIALDLREFIRGYLELDDYAVGQPNFSYPVHSVYFDSDDLKTYHDTLNGNKNRYKLRLRYYDEKPETPVFFEVKGRVDNCILKQRAPVKREAVALIGAGQLAAPHELFSTEPRHLAAVQRFNFLQHRINARPKAHNRYMREAWVSPNDNSVRITFDREVQIEPHFECTAVTGMKRPVKLFQGNTILEIKFTNRFPSWFTDLVERFNLMWSASAKYAGGVLLMGEHYFHDGWRTTEWERRQPSSDDGLSGAEVSHQEDPEILAYD